MNIEIISPELSSKTNFIELKIESHIDFEAVRETICVPQPFPFKGDQDLINKMKEQRGTKLEVKEGQTLDEALADAADLELERKHQDLKKSNEEELKTTEDPAPLLYDKDWHEAREKERKRLRAEAFGGEDLLGAHAFLIEKVNAIDFAEYEVLAMGEEETLAFGELLEAYLKKKAAEKKKKEKNDEEGSGGGQDDEEEGAMTPEENLFEQLIGILSQVKKEGSKVRNRKKLLTKQKNKPLTR